MIPQNTHAQLFSRLSKLIGPAATITGFHQSDSESVRFDLTLNPGQRLAFPTYMEIRAVSPTGALACRMLIDALNAQRLQQKDERNKEYMIEWHQNRQTT